MKRKVIPELLDSDAGTPSEIAASLSDLNRINRWFGGIATTQSLVERVAQRLGARSLSLLEVAAGSGAVPAAVTAAFAKTGVQIDSHATGPGIVSSQERGSTGSRRRCSRTSLLRQQL